jgi:hypothetical protein
MRACLRLPSVALLVACACACGARDGSGERFVVRRTWLSECPSAAPICVEGSTARDNKVVAEVTLAEAVEAERVGEVWFRVRTAKGKVGYVQAPFLAPPGAVPAAAIEPAACYGGRFLGAELEKTLEPGRLVFLEKRRLGRARVAQEPGCPWVRFDSFSDDAADVELALVLARIPEATGKEAEQLREQARQLAPRTLLRAAVAAVEARYPAAPEAR